MSTRTRSSSPRWQFLSSPASHKAPFYSSRRLAALLVVFSAALCLPARRALAVAGNFWDPNGTVSVGGTGSWDTTSLNWSASPTGGSGFAWTNGSSTPATLGGTAGTLTLGAAITAGTVTVNTAGYTIASTSASDTLTATTLSVASNVGLTLGLNTTASATWTIGNITGSSGSTLTLSDTAGGSGMMDINFTTASGNENVPVTISGTSTGLVGFYVSTVTGVTMSGNIANSSSATTMLGASGTTGAMTYSGVVSGSAGLEFIGKSGGGGAGTVTLTNQSTYSGNTIFDSAPSNFTLKLGTTNALPTTTTLIWNVNGEGGNLDLDGNNQTVESITSSNSGSGTITNGAASGTSTLTINDQGNTISNSFGLVIQDGTNAHVALALASTETGTQTLSAHNTYTGGTTIYGGTLAATNGTASTGTGGVVVGGTVNSIKSSGTPTLAGTGTITGAVTINGASGTGDVAGNLSPGSSGSGTLTLSGGLTLNTGAILNYALGTSSTQVSLGSTTLTIGQSVTLNVTQNVGFGAGTYTLISSTSPITNNSSNFTNWTTTGIGSDTAMFSIVGDNLDVTIASGARSLYWIGSGSSGSTTNWDTTTANWTTNAVGNTPTTTFSSSNADNVTFDSTHTTPGTINIATGGVTPGSVAFTNTSGTYTLVSQDSIGLAGSTNALTMSGTGGTLVLSGQNTYGGGTNLNGGTISISNDNNLGAAAGALLFGGGTLKTTATVTSARSITVGASGGTIDTNGFGFSTSNTTAINGTLTKLSAGNLALNGAVTFSATAGALNISAGSVTLGQTTATVSQAIGGTYNGNLVVGGPIRVNFDGGTFSGTGQIQVSVTGAVISNTSGTTGGTINVPIALNSLNQTFTPGDVTAATFAFGSFYTTIGGTTSTATDTIGSTSGISGNSDLNIGNNATGGGGAGTLLLNAASNYAGTTAINTAGTIKLGVTNALPTGTNVIVGTQSGFAASTLDLNGNSQQIASLSDGANVSGSTTLTITNNSSTTDSLLTIDGSTTPANGSKMIIDDGSNGHKVQLLKAGSNTYKVINTASEVSNYSGGTTIFGGTLVAANSNSSTSATGFGTVTVGGAGTLNGIASSGTPTLAGTGFIGGSVAPSALVTINGASGPSAAGTLSPGLSNAGTLTLGSGLTLSSGANLSYSLGTSSTLTNVTGGTLTLNPSVTLSVTQGTGFATGTTYQLIQYSSLTDNSSGFSGWSVNGAAGDTPTFGLDTTNKDVDVSFAPTPAAQTTIAASGSVASPTTVPTSFGAAVQWSVQNGGGSYAGFQSSVTGPPTGSGGGPLLTQVGGGALTATLLAGTDSGTFTTGSTTNVAESWRTRTAYETSPQEGGTPSSPPLQYVGSYLISNVLNLSGMGNGTSEPNQTDPFVLQMQYNQSLLSNETGQAKKGTIYLGWMNPTGGPGGTPQWQKAFTGDFTNVLTGNGTVAGAAGNGADVSTSLGINYQGNFATFLAAEETAHAADFPGTPTAASLTDAELALLLGAYGVDTGGHDVWAVVNHNSQFAVVPEPSSVALVLLGLAGLAGHRWRRR